MRMLFKTFLLVSALVIGLVGCGKENSKANTREIIIPKTEFYQYLFIQSVDDKGISTKETSKLVEDPAVVQDYIRTVNRSVVMVPKTEKQAEVVKQLDKQGSYIIALGDTKEMNKLTYKIYMLKDGTIFFQDTMKKEMMYMTVKKEPEKLEKVKKILDINF
ncbi:MULTISPECIES: hypothetical protein [unclassified Rummeliibacillus]|uniref:hypothetical protein n=1 Tax=unclassified Rummeliibacillus TaxID=2622809 RepID=UPI000E667750|nr:MULTISPECIES: hypothetical protein [unclassified Rummeliibacillus]RIJ63192.1 hypothetical protein D1606_16195 [Rummeliibacillus sp. POC4]RPJ95375.1 hypothetical protein CW357_10890 [Rummeliibacillus sp. TYF005]